MLRILSGMHAVASNAAHIAFTVGGALEVGVLAGVAIQALRIHLFRAVLGGIEDLGYISAALHVGFARAVAVLAGDSLLAMHLGHLGMRIRSESLGNFLVTSGAGLRPYKFRGGWLCRLLAGGLGARSGHCCRCQNYESENREWTSLQSPMLLQDRTTYLLQYWSTDMHEYRLASKLVAQHLKSVVIRTTFRQSAVLRGSKAFPVKKKQLPCGASLHCVSLPAVAALTR
jgi:hypothetical protein